MKIGRYQIIEELGRGAMGVVYRAHDPQIDRDIALKVLRKDNPSSKQVLARFLKEARAIGRLSHPNIVTVFDAGQDPNGTIYIAEEFLEGQPLDMVMKERRLDLDQVVDVGIHLAEAVDYSHDRGIIHRDMKPSNVLITTNGQVKIMDFGIAHVDDPTATSQTQIGEILGTPAYIAPELLNGQKIDGRADIYAIGIILYELVAGCRPFQGANMTEMFRSIIQDEPPSPLKLNPNLPKYLAQIILKCLRKNPDARYPTGDALAKALAVSLGKDPTEVQGGAALPVHSGLGRKLARGLMVLAVMGAVGGIAYFRLADGLRQRPDKTQPISYALLQVDSKPRGAQLYIMGEFKGQTPVDLRLPLGDYRVRLTLQGYYNWEKDVPLKQAAETPLFVEMKPVFF